MLVYFYVNECILISNSISEEKIHSKKSDASAKLMNFYSFQYTYAFMNSFCYILVHENVSVGTQRMQPTDLIFTEILLNFSSYVIKFPSEVNYF